MDLRMPQLGNGKRAIKNDDMRHAPGRQAAVSFVILFG
jgi:hypothetical protein